MKQDLNNNLKCKHLLKVHPLKSGSEIEQTAINRTCAIQEATWNSTLKELLQHYDCDVPARNGNKIKWEKETEEAMAGNEISRGQKES